MTVSELIRRLEKYDGSREVVFTGTHQTSSTIPGSIVSYVGDSAPLFIDDTLTGKVEVYLKLTRR